MSDTTVIKATPTDAGCWIDSTHGIYGVQRVCELAIGHGWNPSHADRRIIAEYPDGYMSGLDNIMWLADDAEAWLNDNVAPDGYHFTWDDGDFMLTATDDEDDQ